tara:strand:- start:9 stop:386 length:378 start_codon:yes stop_codon:yes gene_type:complete
MTTEEVETKNIIELDKGVDKRKMADLSQVVKDHDLEVKGDKSLIEDVERESKVSDEQLMLWKDNLEKMFPEIPSGILKQTLDMYKYNPEIFDRVVEQDKLKPFPEKPKESLKFPEDSDTVEIKSS